MTETINSGVIKSQVVLSLTEFADDYDLDGIVTAFIQKFGRVNIDDVDTVKYWNLVAEFDRRGNK